MVVKIASRLEPVRHPEPGRLRAWHLVCPSGALRPGKVMRWSTGTRELVLFRGRSGAVHALAAHCPHMGAHLGVAPWWGIRCGVHSTTGSSTAVAPAQGRRHSGPSPWWSGTAPSWSSMARWCSFLRRRWAAERCVGARRLASRCVVTGCPWLPMPSTWSTCARCTSVSCGTRQWWSARTRSPCACGTRPASRAAGSVIG